MSSMETSNLMSIKPEATHSHRHSTFNPENDLRHPQGAGITDYGHVAVNGPRQTVSGAVDGLETYDSQGLHTNGYT